LSQLLNESTGDPAGCQVTTAADLRRHGQGADDAQQLHMRVFEHANDATGRWPGFGVQT